MTKSCGMPNRIVIPPISIDSDELGEGEPCWAWAANAKSKMQKGLRTRFRKFTL
jgi:hypothetical protein